jgi:hypothetical protein
MADKNLIRENNAAIEVYRSSDAAPDNWEDAKFWLVNELRRIQNGFFSVDDVINSIGNLDGDVGDNIIQNITNQIEGDTNFINQIISNPEVIGPAGPEGPEGPEGPQGPQGPAGADGNAGDLIADYKTALDFTWSSEKIVEYVMNELLAFGTTVGSGVTIGGTAPDPVTASAGDLFFDNVQTFDLYVFDGTVWLNTDKEVENEVYVQRNIPQPHNNFKPYLWVQTGMGEDGTGFSLWFNDPEY